MKNLIEKINEGASSEVYFNITLQFLKELKKLASTNQIYDEDPDHIIVANVNLKLKNDKVESIEIKDADEDKWKEIKVY